VTAVSGGVGGQDVGRGVGEGNGGFGWKISWGDEGFALLKRSMA
jgi:hypothetical protein